jgi:hypothetical protein
MKEMTMQAVNPEKRIDRVRCTWAGVLIVVAAASAVSRPAAATEKFAAQTGVPCAQCHEYPTGDMRLTPFGQAFVANGFKLPKTPSKPGPDESKPPANETTPPK